MTEILTAVYPQAGDTNVPVDAFFIYDLTSESAIDLSQVKAEVRFGTPPDPAYPVSPDYYGSSLNKNFLSSTSGALVDGFYEVMTWGGSSFNFVAEAAANSEVLQSSANALRIKIQFNEQVNYGTQHIIKISSANLGQENYFVSSARTFYSPSLGDQQSVFESFFESNNWQSVLPNTWKLRNFLLARLDTRAEKLAIRRFMLLALERQLGFPDLPTEVSQIQKDFRLIRYPQVFEPRGLKDIDTAMGGLVAPLTQAAIAELRMQPGIPKSWVEPLVNSADFLKMDLTYRVRLPVQTVAVATRAVQERYV